MSETLEIILIIAHIINNFTDHVNDIAMTDSLHSGAVFHVCQISVVDLENAVIHPSKKRASSDKQEHKIT